MANRTSHFPPYEWLWIVRQELQTIPDFMLRSTGVKMGVHIDDYWKVVAVEGQGERVIEKIPRFRLLRPGEQNAALIYGLVERLHYFDGVFPSELTMRLRTRSGLGRLYRKAQW